MSAVSIDARPARDARPACNPATRTTKSLLGYGVIAGPIYVAVSVAQALTRDGFDLRRHAWSLLSNGSLGWIQITNFLLAGAMTVAAALGLRRAGASGARLLAVYGSSIAAAGIFRADPAQGFPAGTPADAHAVSWHGAVHFGVGAVGFACLVAACLVAGRRFAAEGRRGWAGYSAATGVLFLAGFAGIASGASTLGFVAAVVLAWAWLAALSIHYYRRQI